MTKEELWNWLTKNGLERDNGIVYIEYRINRQLFLSIFNDTTRIYTTYWNPYLKKIEPKIIISVSIKKLSIDLLNKYFRKFKVDNEKMKLKIKTYTINKKKQELMRDFS